MSMFVSLRKVGIVAFCMLVVLFAYHGITLSNENNQAVERASSIENDEEILRNIQQIFLPSQESRNQALAWLRQRNKTDVVAPLIYALRYVGESRGEIASTLQFLTGANNGNDWFQWMLWQEAHPEIKPFDKFGVFQTNLFASIDPNFTVFLQPGVEHSIRLEEIAWGGVRKDGIPALTNPKFIKAKHANYLDPEEPVFGIEINGDVRAYPYRMMDWHEMFNDVIGGVPVSLAYCTLCGSGILFDTRVEGYDKPFIFGSSGFLYRSNKLMYDQRTHSLWNQFTGKPVVGQLTGSGITLKVLPVITTSWQEWKTRYPNTKVLALDTGYIRDYTPGKPYASYFNSPDLMFPALTDNKALLPKEQVFGLRITGSEKAWPLSLFAEGKVINDRTGIVKLVLIGDAATRTVRAYRRGNYNFQRQGNTLNTIEDANGGVWRVTESVLLGPNGESLSRLPGHLAYWFAWSGYLKNAEFGGVLN